MLTTYVTSPLCSSCTTSIYRSRSAQLSCVVAPLVRSVLERSFVFVLLFSEVVRCVCLPCVPSSVHYTIEPLSTFLFPPAIPLYPRALLVSYRSTTLVSSCFWLVFLRA